MLLGMLTPRISARGAQAGLFGGVLFGVAAFALGAHCLLGASKPFLRQAQFLTFFTSAVALVGMAAGSLLAPDAGERRERVAAFFARFRAAPATAQPNVRTADFSFLPVIAAAIAAVGAVLIGAVLLSGQAAAGRLSIAVGCALLLVAAGFWLASRRIH